VRAKLSNGELAVRGDQWPMLVYANQEYDPEEPWEGLFRSQLLVWVSRHLSLLVVAHQALLCTGLQTHLYLPQFGRERGEGDEIGQCAYPRYDPGDNCVLGICGYTGESEANFINPPLNIQPASLRPVIFINVQ
jgi:hypothetical protein